MPAKCDTSGTVVILNLRRPDLDVGASEDTEASHRIVLPQLDQLGLSALSSQLSAPHSQLSLLKGVLSCRCSALHAL